MADAIVKSDAQTPSVLDLLLGENIPNVLKDLPVAQYKVKRLSELAGADVVFTLRGLP